MKNKTKLILFVLAFASVAVFSQEPLKTNTIPDEESLPEIAFEQETYDFGSIEKGKPVTASFSFTNDGQVPLIINDVRKSCGCTKVTFPHEPVLPGKTGIITATYNAASAGRFMKRVTVLANTRTKNHVLTIRGEVQQPAAP